MISTIFPAIFPAIGRRAATTLRACVLLLAVCGTAASAQDEHQHMGHQHGAAADASAAMPPPLPPPPPPFIASTEKPFARLMDDAMAVMDYGMRSAPMNGVAEHDFVTMMMPHHQGAIDMARALLLTTHDPALRNLAQGIIAEQQIEIQRMQAWLAEHPQRATL